VVPADVAKLDWDPCMLENERRFGRTWSEIIQPSFARDC
jgi:hypothetical protein